MIVAPLNWFLVDDVAEVNTYIGGVSSVITNATQLASYLSITDANISDFSIGGDDIKCIIDTAYTINTNAFRNDGGTGDWGNGALVTYFFDKGDKCTSIGEQGFEVQTNMRFIIANAVTYIGTDCFRDTALVLARFNACTQLFNKEHFRNCDLLDYVYLPVCTTLGLNATDNSLFFLIGNASLKVVTNNFLSTVNAGSPDGDLVYVTGTIGGTVTYVANTTAPSSISDLAMVTIYDTAIEVDWTAPSSTNSIDHYEIYVDEIFTRHTTDLSYIVNGLTINTEYSIYVKTVDIYGNISDSNIIVQSTSNLNTIPLGNIISQYKFENNVLDTVGSKNGTAASLTYANGLVEKTGVFNGTTSRVLMPSNMLPASEFSISFLAKVTSGSAEGRIIGMSNNTNVYCRVAFNDGGNLNRIGFVVYDGTSGASITVTGYTLTNWTHIVITGKDSDSSKIYVNGVYENGNLALGSFAKLTGSNYIGSNRLASASFFNGDIDCVRIWDKELTASEVTEIADTELAGVEINP
jgi:hypothetical protein